MDGGRVCGSGGLFGGHFCTGPGQQQQSAKQKQEGLHMSIGVREASSTIRPPGQKGSVGSVLRAVPPP